MRPVRNMVSGTGRVPVTSAPRGRRRTRPPGARSCRCCRLYWRHRAAELFAAAIAHVTKREIDLQEFARELAEGM